jgi:hypothetical protein
MVNKFEYDVALSFAGEDRAYVEKVAKYLKEKDIEFFYDEYEKTKLWGKDLYNHLDEVYQKKARYCVMFLSCYYAEKLWTNHERKSAQARAFTEKGEYILPARFDNTEIPGIPPTIGYIDLRSLEPEEFGKLIIEKLKKGTTNISRNTEVFRKPQVSKIKSFNPYEETQNILKFIPTEIQKRCDSLSEQGVSCSVFNRGGRTCIRILLRGETKYSLDMGIGGIGGDDSIGFYGVEGKMLSSSSGSFNAWVNIKWSQEKDDVVIIFNDISLLNTFNTHEKEYTKKEFLEALWNKICDVLERK